MDIQAFWESVRNERDEIVALIQKQALQPKGAVLDRVECRKKGFSTGYYQGACFITSIKNRDQVGMKEGVVSEATINLAGQRVAEGSHRLATDEEIKAYRKAGQDRADEVRRMEMALRGVNRKPEVIEAQK